MAATVMTLVEDLIFLSKIQGAAKAAGVNTVAGEWRRGPAAAAEAQPSAIFLDLNHGHLPVVEWIRALKADSATRQIRLVGFVSHVQEQLIAEARAAGCDMVMARSAFAQQLPGLLRGIATETARSGAATVPGKEH